jgi:hypothetical protein
MLASRASISSFISKSIPRAFACRPTATSNRSIARRFANVQPGASLALTVKKVELANPYKPPLDPVPTVFTYGMKDDQMAYSTLAGRKKWEETNKMYGFVLACVLAVMGGGVGFMSLRP